MEQTWPQPGSDPGGRRRGGERGRGEGKRGIGRDLLSSLSFCNTTDLTPSHRFNWAFIDGSRALTLSDFPLLFPGLGYQVRILSWSAFHWVHYLLPA